jgi:hypothetical protein
MNETSKNATKKTINWSLLALFIFFFILAPGLSWLYLKMGYNWRKEAITELQHFGQIRSAPIIYANGVREDRAKGKVCVIHIFGANPDLTPANQRVLDINEKLFNQFKESDYFRLVMVAEGGTAAFKSYMQKQESVDFVTSVYTGGVASWEGVMNNSYDLYKTRTGARGVDHWYALTDTMGTIRRFYDAEDDKEVDRMVQQIAILLPK